MLPGSDVHIFAPKEKCLGCVQLNNRGRFNPIPVAFHEYLSILRDATLERPAETPGWSHDATRDTFDDTQQRANPYLRGKPGL